MTNEERDLISQFVARVGGSASGGGVFARSVPSTQPSLPPIDPEADRFIAAQFASHPEARYRVTQMAVVQEAALAEAASRMQKMQAELEQMRQQMQQMQQSAPSGQGQPQSRGFLGSLFGGGAAASSPPHPQSPWNQGAAQPQYAPQPQAPSYAPQYPPNTQPGMFQRSGSGFLGSALTTAAGVAGGVVGANLLMDMFSGHGGGGLGGGMGGGGGFGAGPNETTIINNYGDGNAAPSDWGGAPSSSDWGNATQGGPSDSGFADNGGGSGWDNVAQDSSGFDDTST